MLTIETMMMNPMFKKGFDAGFVHKWFVEDEFDEDLHPRDESGKFSSTGGGGHVDRPIISADKVAGETERILEKTKDFTAKPQNGNPDGQRILHALGYDGKPTVLSPEEFEKYEGHPDVSPVLYRGVTGIGGVTAMDMAEQFQNGELYCGQGVYGNGTYTANSKWTAEHFASQSRRSGAVMEIKLAPDAKIIDSCTLEREIKMSGNKDVDRIMKDVGYYAAIKGYDAVSGAGRSQIVILNRTKAVVNSKVERPTRF